MTDAVPRTSAGLRVVAFVFAAFGLFWGGQAVATADVEHALHLSHGGFGVLLSVALAGAAVSNAVFGSLSERLGTQALLASALVVWSAVLVVGSLVRPPWALGLALVGVVATAGAVDVVMNVAATAALAGQPGRLVRFHGLFNAGAAVGALAMGVVLRAGASWRWMWLASGLVVAAGAVACRRVELPAGEAGEAHSVGQSIRALRAEGLVLLAIAFATAAMVEGGIETWGVLFLRERVGTGVLLGAGAAVAGYAVATLARISLGQAIGAAGPARGVAMGAALASAGLVVLAIGRPAALAAVGLVMGAAGVSVCWPLLLAHATRARERPGLVVGGVSAVGYLGFVIGPSVVGWTAAAFGLRGGLVILAVAAAFVAIAPRTVPSITSQPQEPAAPAVS